MKEISIKDVFISYRRDGGAPMAHLLYHRLTADGYTVFLDAQLGKGRFDKELYKRIEDCTDFLLVVSANSLDRCKDPKDWVRREIEHALRCGKNIVPVIMSGCTIPEDIPESIQAIQMYQGVPADLVWKNAVFDKLEQTLMAAKPRVSVTDLDVADLESSERQPHAESVLLHQQMSQKALQDTMNNADDYNMAICASRGEKEAQYQLSQLYRSKSAEIGIWGEEAIYWLKLAVAQNHPKAMYCLGEYYYSGYGVQHPAKAVLYLRKSLEYDENLNQSMYLLGECYLRGIGVEPDIVQAANFYQKAMKAGNVHAAVKYAELLHTADAVKKLSIANISEKIRRIKEKKETVNWSKVFRLLAMRMLGVIKYDGLQRFRLLESQGHTTDQMNAVEPPKNSLTFMYEMMESVTMELIMIGLILILMVGFNADSPFEGWNLWLRDAVALLEIPDVLLKYQAQIKKCLEVTEELLAANWMASAPQAVATGMAFIVLMNVLESIKNPHKMSLFKRFEIVKFLPHCAIFLISWYWWDMGITWIALIIYLIIPHRIIQK